MMILDRRRFLGVAATLAGLWRALPARAELTPRMADRFRLIEAKPTGDARQWASLGYEGASPGPLIRLKKGADASIRLLNSLDAPTTLNWCGMRIANAMAGVGGLTQTAAAPGAHFDYVFRPPDSGLSIYRPHAGAATAGQMARGLGGLIIVEDAVPVPVDLEAVVALRDIESDPPMLANGAATPLLLTAAPGARVRLRLASLCAARIMVIGIEGVAARIIAIDGQPCEAFEPLRHAFPMGPGARFELMFELPHDGAVRFVARGGGATPSEPDRPLVEFSLAGDPPPARADFAGLPANPALPAEIALQAALRVDLVIAGGAEAPFTLNGAHNDGWSPKPLFSVGRGAPVTIGVVNRTAVVQAIRLSGHVARLLHPLDDGWEPYWRDSVLTAPGKTDHLAFVADNPGRWPLESAILDHQARGVATFFEVR
jgi:FtsP/CotA-like multicopper oxidase with cupredoxin domain